MEKKQKENGEFLRRKITVTVHDINIVAVADCGRTFYLPIKNEKLEIAFFSLAQLAIFSISHYCHRLAAFFSSKNTYNDAISYQFIDAFLCSFMSL